MKVMMLFPGYGSQYVGMGKELYDNNRVVQDFFEEASNCLDINFVKLCFATSEVEMSKITNAYPSLFLMSCSIYALLREKNIVPHAVAGYAQGEYAALFAAGGMTFPDGLYLLMKLATFFQQELDELKVSASLVTGIDAQDLERACDRASTHEHKVFISIYRGPAENVVAGHVQAVDRLPDFLPLGQIQQHDADVELGLYSPLMGGVLNQFKIYLGKVDFKDLTIPLYSCADGKPLEDGGAIKTHIAQDINTPIRWANVMEACSEYDIIVEVGPGTMLRDFIQAVYPNKQIVSINNQADIDALQALMSNVGN